MYWSIRGQIRPQIMPSLDKYDDKYTEPPNTPRSLLACKRAGVFAEDLAYYPLDQFLLKYKHKKIAYMHFDAREADRREDLERVLSEYHALLENGVTESEYLIMGRATVLQPLVTQWAPPLGVDQAAVNAAAEKARLELLRANERFDKIQEFQQQKAEERAQRNLELQRRLEQKHEEEQKRIAEQQRLAAERQQRSEEERQAREREMQEKSERQRHEAELKDSLIYQRLIEFKEVKQKEIEIYIMERDERKERAVEHFYGIMADRYLKMAQKLENQRRIDYERELYLKARQDMRKQQEEEKAKEIRRQIERFYEEETKKRAEQSYKLDNRLERSYNYYEEVMRGKCHQLHERDVERTQKIERSKTQVYEDQESLRRRVDDKEKTAEQRYLVYHEDVLMQQQLYKEQQKIENERRAKKALRLADFQQFYREMKTNEMKRKMELLEDQYNQKRAQTIGLVQAKSRLEAQKLKENFERNYLHKTARSCTSSLSSSAGTPAARTALSMRASAAQPMRTQIEKSASGQRGGPAQQAKPTKEAQPTQNELLARQNAEMREIQNKEKKREAERRKLLADAYNDQDRAVLMRQFADERKQAAQAMKNLNQKHKKQLDNSRM